MPMEAAQRSVCVRDRTRESEGEKREEAKERERERKREKERERERKREKERGEKERGECRAVLRGTHLDAVLEDDVPVALVETNQDEQREARVNDLEYVHFPRERVDARDVELVLQDARHLHAR
jgi:beta-phosphoglucomutase-like phosphatase (HAD superfamily)